jgi:rhodanese-related sulfurtransferase
LDGERHLLGRAGVIYSRAWLVRKEVAEFNRLAPYNRPFIPRLAALADINCHPIPSLGPVPSLYGAAIERAQELKAKYTSLYVPLSGGVDSSTVAAALAKIGARPVIGLSATGQEITEPAFLEWLQSHGCTIETCGKTSIKSAVERGLHVVTGTHGDNLFTGDTSFELGLVDDVWHMTPNEVLSASSGLKGDLWKIYGHLFADMPANIPRTAANVLWWISFAGHWSVDCYYLTADIGIGAPGVTHTHFFGSVGYQRWMMQDAAVRCGKSYATVKEQGIANVGRLVGFDVTIPSKTGGWDDIRSCQGYKIFSIDNNWNIKGATR